jgi:signal transduction histidine kinase
VVISKRHAALQASPTAQAEPHDPLPGARGTVADYLQAARRIALAGSAADSAADPKAVAADGLLALLHATGMVAGSVYLLDEAAQCAHLLATSGMVEDFATRFGQVPLESATLVSRSMRTFQTLTSDKDQPEPPTNSLLLEIETPTWIIVPFHSGGTSGVVSLLGQRDPPAGDEQDALQMAAETLGQSLAGARARRDDLRSRGRSRFLTDTARAFSISLDLPQVLEAVVRLATPVLGEWVLIYLRDGNLLPMRAIYTVDRERLEAIRTLFAAQPLRVGEGVAGNVVLTGEPRIFRVFDDDALHTLAPRASTAYVEALRGLKSWACLPLMARGRGLGALVFATESRTVNDDDLQVATAFAEIAAAAVENARLYDTERGLRYVAEAAQAQLAAADRQKDAFLSVAAHELRTPLTSAQGFAQVLLRRARSGGEPDQRLLDGLGIMEAQLRRIGALLNELLDLSRVETGSLPLRPVQTDVGSLVTTVCDRLRVLPEGERIVLRQPPQPVIAVVDRDRIEQIVINLVENGLKYSPAGGEVTVSLSQAGDELALRVRDRGLGVPPDAVPFMFQRYYRIPDADHQQVNGLGIGLYVCREIAQRHGGSITVEQPDGPGAEFVLRLPLTPPPELVQARQS